MAEAMAVAFVNLAESDLLLAVSDEDLLGLPVVDPEGNRIGEVGDLVLDEDRQRVRLLVVTCDGPSGSKRILRLIPVAAVTLIDNLVQVETVP